MLGLQVIDVSKSFGSKKALVDVTFDAHHEEIVALLGPSGCGKSTMLSLIAGLETPDSGTINWDGSSLGSTPPHLRQFGLMFQDYALFPHRNVYDNVAFGLKMQRLSQTEIANRVHQVLDLVGMTQFSRQDVNTLSGGEQQRVALARSLAPKPRLLMLDEPLGALDKTLRERLVIDLRSILRQSRQTAIYVTHDQEEAFALADRVVLMKMGMVVQIGTPIEIYRNPVNSFVARFLGMNNLLPGLVFQRDGKNWVETVVGTFPIDHSTPIGNVLVLLRPDSMSLDFQKECSLTVIIKERSFRGSSWKLSVDAQGVPLTFEVPASESIPKIGEPVCLSFDPERAIHIFKEDQTQNNE